MGTISFSILLLASIFSVLMSFTSEKAHVVMHVSSLFRSHAQVMLGCWKRKNIEELRTLPKNSCVREDVMAF